MRCLEPITTCASCGYFDDDLPAAKEAGANHFIGQWRKRLGLAVPRMLAIGWMEAQL